MKSILNKFMWTLLLTMLALACKEDDPQLGPPPTEDQAEFTFEPSEESDNIIRLTNTSSAFLKKWDFGNGETAEGDEVEVTYPFAGTYEITLTVYNSGGSVSTKQTIVIENSDPGLLKPVYGILAGNSAEGKTWIVASSVSGHMGVGPAAGSNPDWWAAGPNDKSDTGLYDDKFTFKLNGFQFVQTTNGDVYINNNQASNFPGAYDNKGDKTAPYTAPTNLTWSITTADNGNDVINVTNNGFIGYYTGTSKYEIISITESEMMIKFLDSSNPELAWYHKLVVEGFTPPPPATTNLPVDFEGTKPPFFGFGGTTYDVVANPDATGANVSAKVAKYVKGTEGNWAGIASELGGKLDFSVNTLIKMKVHSPVTGIAMFKIETKDNSAAPIEVQANITQVNQWQELTFDFGAAATNTFDKIAVFMDFANNNGGTFYIDDIRQSSAPVVLTLNDLTGGSAKSWILKPAAGSFGVGPGKGSDAWWPNGANISGDRPCLFNDEFIFKSGDVYEYDAKADIWGEGYMGLTEGCTNESNLPVNAQAWGSGTHSFTFTPATESTPAKITVTGTGAFIALPKAFNGGEYSAAPPTANASVTYEVLNYVKNGSSETLTLTIDISAGQTGGGYWNFVLIPKP